MLEAMRIQRPGRIIVAMALLVSSAPVETQSREWFGRVVEQSTLEPLSGVTIEVLPWPAEHLHAPPDPGDLESPDAPLPARTSVDGDFTLRAPAPSRLRLSAPGHLDGYVLLHAGRDPDLGRLVLRRALSLSGRLVLDGAPAPGVTVLAPEHDDTGARRSIYRSVPRTVSDSDGRFLLDGLSPERVRGLVFAPGSSAQALVFGNDPLDPRGYDLGNVELLPLRRLSGRIVTVDGGPASNALVRLTRSTSVRWYLPDGTGEGYLPLPETRTASDGRFALELPSGEHTLAVYAGERGGTEIEVSIEEDTEDTNVGTVELPGTWAAAGRVVDRAGEPLPGAAVRVASGGPWGMYSEADLRPAGAQAVTDAQGCFRLTGLPHDVAFRINAQIEGHVTQWIRIAADGSVWPFELPDVEAAWQPDTACGTFGTIRLPPAGEIAGQVLDENGGPIAGAEVSARWHQSPPGSVAPSVHTDDQGRFRVERLATGLYDLYARAPGFAFTTVADVAVAAGGGNRNRTQPIAMPAVAETVDLDVLVLDPRGAPEPDAAVRISRNAGSPPTVSLGVQLTGADGRALYRATPTGVYSISARGHGSRNSAPWQSPYRIAPDASVAIIEMSMPLRTSTTTLSGHLVDPEGGGISGALIEARGQLSDRATITQTDGSFRFDRILAGDYLLQASGQRFPGFIHEPLVEVVPSGLADVVLTAPATGAIEGRVLGLREPEVERLGVQAIRAIEPDRGISASLSVYAEIDDDGSFRIAPVSPGEWTVTARVDGAREATTTVVVDERGGSDRVDLSLATGFTLSGRVEWHVPRASRATIALPGGRGVPLGADGGFEFRDVAPGAYRLGVYFTGLRRASYLWVDVEADTEIRFPIRGAALGGRVTDAVTGDPIPGARVRADTIDVHAIPVSGQRIEHRTKPDGTFAIGRLPATRWRLDVRASGYGTHSRIVEIGDDDVAIDMALAPTPGLTLRFETPDRGLPEIVSLAWFSIEDGLGFQTDAFPGPRDTMDFHWQEIGTGRGILFASNRNHRLAARVVVDNEGQPVVVRLALAGRVSVRVPELAATGSRAVLRLYDGAGLPVTNSGGGVEWLGNAGRFRADQLPPGTYRVAVAAHDGRTWEETATIHARELTEIVLR